MEVICSGFSIVGTEDFYDHGQKSNLYRKEPLYVTENSDLLKSLLHLLEQLF
jgi:hypothetical protein